MLIILAEFFTLKNHHNFLPQCCFYLQNYDMQHDLGLLTTSDKDKC